MDNNQEWGSMQLMLVKEQTGHKYLSGDGSVDNGPK
jgi:hypothetical protein